MNTSEFPNRTMTEKEVELLGEKVDGLDVDPLIGISVGSGKVVSAILCKSGDEQVAVGYFSEDDEWMVIGTDSSGDMFEEGREGYAALLQASELPKVSIYSPYDELVN